jgi:DNA-binding SARP family transcriptional activator
VAAATTVAEVARKLEIRILGPLEVVRDGVPVPLGAHKQRALMALLAMRANEVVSSDELIESLWSGSPPPTAATTLQVYVSRVRTLLEPDHAKDAPYDVLVTTPPGYTIRIRPDALDLHRFERLVDEGLAALAASPEAAAATLRDALALWRGSALADVSYESFAQAPAARLEELRLAALEKRIEADLACGRHAELVGELQELCAEHPLREAMAGQLMLALYRSGRQADALETYQRTRGMLVGELGIDPGPALQRLERDILVQDPALELEATPVRLPSGEVTFAFADIEDSTELLHRLGDAYGILLTDYRRLVRESFGARGGQEVDRQGDGLFFVFPSAADAAQASMECQHLVASHAWPSDETVRVRIGLHTGTPSVMDDAYVGLDVHRGARVGAAAHGGQVVVSKPAADAIRSSGNDLEMRALGSFQLKGLPEPESLFQVLAPGLAIEFPTPRVASRVAIATPPTRAVLVVSPGGVAGKAVVHLAGQLASGPRPHELVLAQLVDPSDSERLSEITASLGASAEEHRQSGAAVRVAAFTSHDVAHDVERLAARSDTDLLLMAASDEVLRSGSLDATLHSVLEDVLCDVAFLAGRGLDRETWAEGPVIVPFGADVHDWAALELGAWLARGGDRPLHILGTDADTDQGTRDASRLLADAGLLIQRASGVAPVPKLVQPGRDGPVKAAADGGLLVIGLSADWREEGLGMTRWAIAQTVAAPVLFVRRGLRPGGLAPDASVTRFAWSVTMSA